jgi:hypothetical protein
MITAAETNSNGDAGEVGCVGSVDLVAVVYKIVALKPA